MKIAIVGAGRMGTALGWFLARAGHEVTLVARGKRLAELEKVGAIETVEGGRAPVTLAAQLDTTVPYDGVLVTVLAHQTQPLLPTLRASQARSIVFLFNTTEALQPFRDAMGPERAVFGFPSGFSLIIDGKLRTTFSGPGQEVTIDSKEWSNTFKAAKLPSSFQPDMEAFLRTHAAMVIPMMASGVVTHDRGNPITWAEAGRYAKAGKEGVAVVKKLGHKLVPASMGFMLGMPTPLLQTVVFLMNKMQVQKELGSMGPGEVRELIDGMERLAPGACPVMQQIRP